MSMLSREACLPICTHACALLGDIDSRYDPNRAHEYCGGCREPKYRCQPLAGLGIMRESCNVLHDGVEPSGPFRASDFQPKCPGSQWQLNRNLTAGFCEHWSLGEEGPLDATQVEDSHNRKPIYTCLTPSIRGVVAGPFFSLPGQFTSFSIELSRLLKAGDRLVEYHGEAVDSRGMPISYPPLHMHHIHIGRDFPKHMTLHWFETHGDYGVGPNGYQPGTKLPAGYCDVLAQLPTYSDGQVNDVRFSSDTAMSSDGKASFGMPPGGAEGPADAHNHSAKAASAPRIEWWLRLYFRMSLEPCKLANQLILWHPIDDVVRQEKLVRFDVGNAPMVRWWTLTLPNAGTILPQFYVHSHRGRYGGALVVKGRHSLWSLAGMTDACVEEQDARRMGGTGSGSERPDCAASTGLSWDRLSMADLRAHLARRASQTNDLVCHDVAEVPVYLHLPAAADGSGGYHDRAGDFSCQAGRKFQPGEEWTVFYFSVPNFNPRIRTYLQHVLIFLRYDPDVSRATSIVDEVFPEQYSSWDLGAPTYSTCEVLRRGNAGVKTPSQPCEFRPTLLPNSK